MDPAAPGPRPQPRLSIIIPAHDEAAVIGPTLDAAHAAARSAGCSYEIIVAADGCTDATAAIAAARGAVVVEHARRQIAATRNLGARHANGEVLLFVDADTQINAPALAQTLAAIDAGAVGGGALVRFHGPVPLFARLGLRVLVRIFRTLKLTGGAFLFCTHPAFDAAGGGGVGGGGGGGGGWDERYYAGEEIFMARALKRWGGRGRFVIVRDLVLTSGRKLRTHSVGEILGVCVMTILRPGTPKKRERLGFFYGPRRADPFRGEERENAETR